MKGHLCLKSGPYATTSSKYSTQMLVKANLDAHHRMIIQAKPAIDNKTPKAFQTSTKARDKLKREMIKNGRPPPRRTQEYNYDFSDEINAIMHRTRQQNDTNASLTMGRPQSAPGARSQSPRPARCASAPIKENGTGAPPQSPRFTSTGDVLQDRKHVFTEPDRPFTPRTLKTTRKSKLVEMKYYNRPPKKVTIKAPDSRKSTSANGELNMTFEPLRSRDLTKPGGNVPKLDITQDEDHLKWLAKQAVHAEHRQGMNKDRDDNKGPLIRSKSLDQEEEELKLLDFVNEVTNDVLDRGIYTSTALQSVFDHHIDKNADKLNVKRMHEALEKLRLDLGISETSEPAQDFDAQSVASSKGSGLERYKKNLDRALREAELDYNVARQKPEETERLLAGLPEPGDDDHVDYHPPPAIPESLLQPDEDLDGRSQASVKSKGSVASVRSEAAPSHKSEGSKRGSVVGSQAGSKRGSITEGSVKSAGQASAKSISHGSVKSAGQGSVKSTGQGSVQSESLTKENLRVNQCTPEPPKRTSISSIKSAKSDSTLKGSNARVADERQSDVHTPSKRGSIASVKTSSSQRAEAERNGDHQDGEEIRGEELDLQSDAFSESSTVVGDADPSLNSTMESLADENKWMKNPSQFTMTLKPGQLDMSVVKPRANARKRELRRQKNDSIMEDGFDRESKDGSVNEGGSRASSIKDGVSLTGSVKDDGSKPGSVINGGSKPGSVINGGSKPGSVKDGGSKPGSIKDGDSRPGSVKEVPVARPRASTRGSQPNSARLSEPDNQSGGFSDPDGPDDF